MWPHPFTLDNFKAVMTPETTYIPLLNGAILCVGGTLITMVCATLAAYPLSRYRSRLKRPFLVTILFSTGLPITAIMVPVYGLFVQLALDDSIPATMVFMATTAPTDLDLVDKEIHGRRPDRARGGGLDGRGESDARTVANRDATDGTRSVGRRDIHLHRTMGELLRSVHPAPDPEKQPMSVTIYTFFGQYGQVVYGQLAAYSLLYSLPSVLLYLVLSRRLGGAFAFGGGVKG